MKTPDPLAVAASLVEHNRCPVCASPLKQTPCPDCADDWIFDPGYCATCADAGTVIVCPNCTKEKP